MGNTLNCNEVICNENIYEIEWINDKNWFIEFVNKIILIILLLIILIILILILTIIILILIILILILILTIIILY